MYNVNYDKREDYMMIQHEMILSRTYDEIRYYLLQKQKQKNKKQKNKTKQNKLIVTIGEKRI